MKKIIRFAAVAFAGLGLALPLAAAAKDGPPPLGEPRGFTLPKVETYALRNGVKVTLVPYGRVPKADISVVVRVGNLNDGDTPLIADLTVDMMREGAGGKSAAELAPLAAAMGGDLNLGVTLDDTYADMDVLSDRAPDALALLADILQYPDFPESEFDRVQQNRLRDLSVAETQPQSIADDAFNGLVYPDHPYARAILPDPEGFAALTLDDVKAFYAANFGGQRTHIYVVGQFDRAKIRKAIAKSFGKWKKGPAPLVSPPAMPKGAEVVLIDRPGAVQSTIRFGQRVPPIDETLDMEAADTMLGGYFSSRITRNIREDKGYTYSPYSFVSGEAGVAYWTENADITSEATGPALAEILKEIKDLQDNLPPAEELQGVKNYMSGIFVIRLASRGGMSNQLQFVDLHKLGLDYLASYVDKTQALTAEDVQAAARTHLPIDGMDLVVVGDLKSVRPQLEALPDFADRLPE